MYPISAEEQLSFLEIADHWAGELGQPNRYDQLLQNLIRGWWGGQFSLVEAERRLAMLKWLYKHHRNDISFLIPGRVEPEATRELPHGGVVVDISYRVHLANDDPSSWTQANCVEAFKVLADKWSLHITPEASNTLAFLKISEADFSSWVRTRGYSRPKFWAQGTRPSRASKFKVLSTTKRRGRKPKVLDRVTHEMQKDIDDGSTTLEKLKDEKQESLACKYGCGRETAQKALAQVGPNLSGSQFPTIRTNDK